MSMQGDLQGFLVTMANGATDGQVLMTPDQMALQTGISRDKVNKTLNNLMTRKRIELLRGENGRSITGYRVLEAPPDKRLRESAPAAEPKRRGRPPRAATVEQQPEEKHEPRHYRRRVAYTPMLDEYAGQKKRFEALTSELGDRIQATFKEDPLAEEALLLRERLELAEDQASDWRHKAEGWEQEVRALRTRHMQAVERKATESGAMVQHSTD